MFMCFSSKPQSTDSINEDIGGEPVLIKDNIGEIHEGKLFFITAILTGDCFHIDFAVEQKNGDIALRLAGRGSTNDLARNARVCHEWGKQEYEKENPIHFKIGQGFRLQVLFTIPEILIAFNSKHIAKFEHRVPFQDISVIEIYGAVTDLHFDRSIVTHYPIAADKGPHVEMLPVEPPAKDVKEWNMMPLPWLGTFEKGFFTKDTVINVVGTVRKHAKYFKISFQSTQNIWPSPTVHLQMEFHFHKHKNGETGEPIITLDSFANGLWYGEKKAAYSTGLRPGAEFKIALMQVKTIYEIVLNEQPLTIYPIHINPKNIDTIRILGDIKLRSVFAKDYFDE